MLRYARRPTCVSRALREIVRVGVCAACVSAVVVARCRGVRSSAAANGRPQVREKAFEVNIQVKSSLYINNRQLDLT